MEIRNKSDKNKKGTSFTLILDYALTFNLGTILTAYKFSSVILMNYNINFLFHENNSVKKLSLENEFIIIIVRKRMKISLSSHTVYSKQN